LTANSFKGIVVVVARHLHPLTRTLFVYTLVNTHVKARVDNSAGSEIIRRID